MSLTYFTEKKYRLIAVWAVLFLLLGLEQRLSLHAAANEPSVTVRLENPTIFLGESALLVVSVVNYENTPELDLSPLEKDFNAALHKARHIDEYNEQRKDIDKQMTEEANQIVAKLENQKHQSSIVLYDENWKKGVIGIVASRLTEIYFRPTVVLTRDEEFATGSARSVAGFDVYSAVKSCRDLLVNFGGHTYAAGLTLRWKDVREFRTRFQQYVEEHIQPEQKEAVLRVDAIIDFKDIFAKRLYSDLKKFAPFGPGNEKPRFCTKGVYDFGTSKVVGRDQEHIKLELVDSKSSHVMNGIAFGQSAAARYIKSKHSFDIVYTLEDNIFKHGSVQLQIEDICPNEELEEPAK